MVDQNQAESSSLKVKLKIQKTQIDSSNTSKNHVCKQCKRSFSSGKALGGHMSAHVQAQANYKDLSLDKKQLLKSKKKTNHTAFGCEICNRLFHSRKSLFGHMKSHPDRHWRGMDPPQDKSQDSFDYDDDLSYSDEDEFEEENQIDLGPVADLSASLTGWGVKGKRGRQEPDSEPDEDQNDLHAAVRQLIRLVNSPVPKKVEVVAENRACGSGPGPEKMVVCENVEPMEKSMSISAGDQEGVEIVSKAKRSKVNGSDETRSPTIQEEKELDSSVCPTPTSTPGKLFKCKICEKGFSTYQGLGGHRSSHNRPRVSISNTLDEVNTNKFRSSYKAETPRGYANLFGSGVPNGQVYNTVPSKGHQANVVVLDRVPCNGQATFGNEGSSVDMNPNGSQATFENRSTQGSTAGRVSSSEQATSANRRTQESKRVLIDLNEFPDEDEI